MIELHDISKRYGGLVLAVDRVSLAVERGSLLALLGPSGCGKSTLLRLIAGLEVPDAGQIWLGATQVAGSGVWVPPEARRVGLVFQDGALFPHLSVADNIAFALDGRPASERQQRVAELLELVGLPGLGKRYPHQLSGGQQQRVALARALANRPPLLLLDEPFSNLDAALRKSLREELHAIVRAAGVTTVFVTHDQEEALSLADRVAVMFAGQITQLETPQQVYMQPATRVVAEFVGEANFVSATANGLSASSVLGRVELHTAAEGPIELMIRPEALVLEPFSGEQGLQGGTGSVERVIYLGHDQLVQVRLEAGELLLACVRPRPDLGRGVRVRVRVQGPVVAF